MSSLFFGQNPTLIIDEGLPYGLSDGFCTQLEPDPNTGKPNPNGPYPPFPPESSPTGDLSGRWEVDVSGAPGDVTPADFPDALSGGRLVVYPTGTVPVNTIGASAAAPADGFMLMIYNAAALGAADIIELEESASSRGFSLSGNYLALGPQQYTLAVYDATLDTWQVD